MYLIHNGRKYKIYSKVEMPKNKKKKFKGYFYIVKFWLGEKWLYKIGFSNDVKRRVIEECRAYKVQYANIIFISPQWQESTARRIEFKVREELKKHYHFIPNDRFLLPDNIFLELDIKVRKTYHIREGIISPHSFRR